MEGINKAKFVVTGLVAVTPSHALGSESCQVTPVKRILWSFFGPVLLTSCLSQDALQRALLPGSGQAGPLGNPLC